MSIIYCHKHDKQWDSDFIEDCPQCIDNDIVNDIVNDELEHTELEIQKGNIVSSEDFNNLWEHKLKIMESNNK